METPTTDGRVQRGNETRRAVLGRAVEVASVEGLEALSIGRLATDLGLSKSGVFASFGSKEELQLAAVRAARRIFQDAVIAPVADMEPGLGRLRALCDSWLAYSRRRVFPGGCFFYAVSAEFDARPGPVRDALAAVAREWEEHLTELARAAREAGGLKADTDLELLVFTLVSLLETANAQSLLYGEDSRYDLAAAGIRAALRGAATAPEHVA
ncbi:TetR/AcrR family transcriptional regulator [Kitasatospora sp. NPDC085879]|uniref:TetR/AcrR family transcriptional regulator n=1 Tax=Kitasatospora sp. NPDC085879 TaxID=3154769 RepID=UPI000BB158A9|nr:TetR/AcrR family transcriptional regulator [Streptomyces sp. TLI_235]PBC78476.1 TetR family transcriptional regulator [Streptomyces sp. TLI_235]